MEVKFKAFFDDGAIMEWYAPQTWKNVFDAFKMAGSIHGHGTLFCDDVQIRETGKF